MGKAAIQANKYDPEPVSREQALAELASFPERLARYRDAVSEWQATGAAQVPDDLLAEGLDVYHVVRRYDMAWALDVRQGRVPMDWEESRRICALYGEWYEASTPVARHVRGTEVGGGQPNHRAFSEADVRAGFAAHADIDHIKEGVEQAERWASKAGRGKQNALGR